MLSAATTAATNASATARAEIVTALSARGWRGHNGSKTVTRNCSTCPISTSCSPCRSWSPPSRSRTRSWLTISCSVRRRRRCVSSPQIRSIWARRSASSVCYIRGDKPCCTTHIFIFLFRAAGSRQTGKAGSSVGRGSSWTSKWVVYAKRPFAGPAQVLDYVGRYTHRVAISNNRLVSMDDGKVRFRWKDYRDDNRQKTMTLGAGEFIRRFLIHVLPDGFHRIRYYGFLGNCHRVRKLALCRELLGVAPPEPAADAPADYRDRFEALSGQSLRACPHCRTGIMVVIDCIAPPKVCQPVPDTS